MKLASRFQNRCAAAAVGLVVVAVGVTGCNDRALDGTSPGAAGSAAPGGLSPERAGAVVAKVGERNITLGDFAATLERMNQYERLKYQTKKRRRELLGQMIDVELLAQEARRRGLHKKPAVQEAIRQILRDAQLAEARRGLPAPAEIPAADVQAYYDKNKDKFIEPERRRVAAIVLGDPDKAAEVLQKALAIKNASEWGELFFEHSLTAPLKRNEAAPADLAGDLGIVGPPGDKRGKNNRVPKEVQKVVFGMTNIGDIHNELVHVGTRHYVVRMVGRSKGHTRTLAEADRGIRVAILQQKIREREDALEKKLRDRYPVSVDEGALGQVPIPSRLKDYKPLWRNDVPSADAAEPAGDDAR